MKIVNIVYHHHAEFNNPEEVIKKHAPSNGFIDFMPAQIKPVLVKHAAFEGAIKKVNTDFAFFRGSNKSWYIPFKTHKYISRLQPDIVMVEGLVFPLQIIALKFILGKKTHILAQHHGELPAKGLKKILQRLADRYISAYLFTSLDNATPWINAGIISATDKCKSLLEASTWLKPSEKKQSRMDLGLEEDKIIYLWVGRLDENKDPVTALHGFEKFAANESKARLYMIYQQESLLKSIEQIIAESEILGHTVKLVGKIPHEQLSTWYSAADFYIAASHREGSGYALLEAMACGCFPVVSNIPTFKKITGYGKAGILFRKADANALALALEQSIAFKNDSLRQKVIRHFEEELSFKKIADDLYLICDDIVSGTPLREPSSTDPAPAYRYSS